MKNIRLQRILHPLKGKIKTSLSNDLYVSLTYDPVRTDSEECGLEMLHRVFQRRGDLFNLLVSIINALTPLVVGMIVLLCVVCVDEECNSVLQRALECCHF